MRILQKNGFPAIQSMSDIAKSAGVVMEHYTCIIKIKNDFDDKGVFNEMVDEKLELIQEAIKDEKPH